ncbi:hypothetical protein [Pseudodonghicola sp.]|uniref:hypothetical protein n=1 Tax=Pseudodonghicola sp. TaxID=1969463 RepID=UPI003A96E491
MHVTIENYCAATGVCAETTGRRLQAVPYRVPERRGAYRKLFPLAAAAMTLKRREIDAGAVAELGRSARPLNNDLYVEPEALPMAREFADWLPDPAMRARLRAAQNSFTVAVANSRLCTPTIVSNLDPLRDLFALCPQVTRWVLAGGTPPDVDHIGPAFAVTNNSAALSLYTNKMMEAA